MINIEETLSNGRTYCLDHFDLDTVISNKIPPSNRDLDSLKPDLQLVDHLTVVIWLRNKAKTILPDTIIYV